MQLQVRLPECPQDKTVAGKHFKSSKEKRRSYALSCSNARWTRSSGHGSKPVSLCKVVCSTSLQVRRRGEWVIVLSLNRGPNPPPRNRHDPLSQTPSTDPDRMCLNLPPQKPTALLAESTGETHR